MEKIIRTDRLMLRPWGVDDATQAMAIYGDGQVTRWLSPVMTRVTNQRAMRSLLRRWTREDQAAVVPAGHWALERQRDGQVVGGMAVRRLDSGEDELEITWQLAPALWGRGYATEAASALTRWAFAHRVLDELFFVVRPNNVRGAAVARRVGMEWVGETEKYHRLRLQVYRVRPADFAAWLGGGPERVGTPIGETA